MSPDDMPILSPRAQQIVREARTMLEEMGWEAVAMRPLAERLGVRAPSIYKHFRSREQIKSVLVAIGLQKIGEALHDSLRNDGTVSGLLKAYRSVSIRCPNLYRLCTVGDLERDLLPPGLEMWAGAPFYTVTQDEVEAQALWSFAHGTMILELDGRYPPSSDIERIWRVGAGKFTVTT